MTIRQSLILAVREYWLGVVTSAIAAIVFVVIGLYVLAIVLVAVVSGVVLEKAIRASRGRGDWLRTLGELHHEPIKRPEGDAPLIRVGAVLSSTYGRHYARLNFDHASQSWTMLLRSEASPARRPILVEGVTPDQLNRLVIDRHLGLLLDDQYASVVLDEYFPEDGRPARVRLERVQMLSD